MNSSSAGVPSLVLAMARAFGGHGERVSEPSEIVPAIRRAIRKTQEGTPALVEFLTEKAEDFSMF